MKNVKRLLGLVMVVAMMAAVIPGTVEAAGKVRLNKKKVTLTITNKKKNPAVTLKVKGVSKKVASKAKWYTSNKKAATVKKGKVTAKKAGKTTITCKVKGKKYTCRVTVKDKRKKSSTKSDSKTPNTKSDSKTPNTKSDSGASGTSNTTPKCNHNWTDAWRYYEAEGDYTGEVYPCACGQVFSSQDEYEKHMFQIVTRRAIEKETGCPERALETGIHGTRSSYTPSITVKDGITHVSIKTSYIEYLYCTNCGEKLSITWDVPKQ